MGLFSRLGRRSPTGATPGEIPAPSPAVAAVASGRGTLSGGVLAADRGLLTYGIGGTQTVRNESPYPGPADQQMSAGRGVVVKKMSDSDASPNNPPYPSVDPGGPASLRGRLSGGALASESGEVAHGPGELVNLRYVPLDPRVVDPDTFLPPVREKQPYRSGRMIISYYIDPLRQWGTMPMFNGAHGQVRRTPYVSPPPVGSQLPQGGPHPAVWRPTPLPWDTGVIRGNPS